MSCTANRSLDRLLRDLPNANILLVFATKQDRPGALSVAEIQHQLRLHQLVDKEWCVSLPSPKRETLYVKYFPSARIRLSCSLCSSPSLPAFSGVFACSAKTGEGIEEGISWLIRQLKQQDGAPCACDADQSIPCFLQQLSV